MRIVIVFIFLFSFSSSRATEYLKIGILEEYSPLILQIIPENGAYSITADGREISTATTGVRITMRKEGDKIRILKDKASLGTFQSAELKAKDDDSYFRIYILNPRNAERVYDDGLMINVKNNSLQLINYVGLEKYVAGVVEAETGKDRTLEFYKVQAIISRTYALSNRRKYLHQGFNLNDKVDSQVYHGKCRWVPEIIVATNETKGLVLTDSDMNLITAAFHSNSGGETVGSQYIWSHALPYCLGQTDDFSSEGEHFSWTKTIAKDKWLAYLEDKYNFPANDKLLSLMATNFEQKHRQVYFIDPEFAIPLKEIRKDWTLNSTLFDIIDKNDSIQFVGRGFGHGIGLSQEGAMRMAEIGFSYEQILYYYYHEVHLIDLKALNFFTQD